jgi:pyridoxal 5'-phosphate synthase pdxT subunit
LVSTWATFLHLTVSRNVAGSAAPRIGVLALQGDVREHSAVLRELGCQVVEIRLPAHLEGIDGLVIPGGESSVMDKLSRIFGLAEPLRDAIAQGLPVLGTCAGLIMVANHIEDAIAGQENFGGLDVTVRRNAFGAQVDSFETAVSVEGVTGPALQVAFIRAPEVIAVGPGARVIATLGDGRVVGVAGGNIIGVAFHPEITGEDRVHRMFLDVVAQRALQQPTTVDA